MKFKITFIDIGRNKHNSVDIKEFGSLDEAEEYAYGKADTFLFSINTSLRGKNGEYTMWAGFRPVGVVEIIEVIK